MVAVDESYRRIQLTAILIQSGMRTCSTLYTSVSAIIHSIRLNLVYLYTHHKLTGLVINVNRMESLNS